MSIEIMFGGLLAAVSLLFVGLLGFSATFRDVAVVKVWGWKLRLRTPAGQQVMCAIFGAPHSGKTVFVGLLRQLLPRDKFMIIEGAPDGEGISGWSAAADADVTMAVRQKGKFLPGFVDWVVASVRASTMPITLVDLGGIRSDENVRMAGECSHFVVISGDPEETTKWIEFGKKLGLTCLGILDSLDPKLPGDDRLYWPGTKDRPLHGRITRLERTAPPHGSLAARAFAMRLLETAGSWQGGDGSAEADVNFPALAEELELPRSGGRSGQNRDWLPGCLPRVIDACRQVLSRPYPRLWGNTTTGACYHTLACASTQAPSYYDPKVGWVVLPELGLGQKTSDHLAWDQSEVVPQLMSLHHFTIPGQIFAVADLPKVVPPMPTTTGVIISGKAPRWLTGALARAYSREEQMRFVAVFEPGETGRTMADGRRWAEHHPGMGSAVVVWAKTNDPEHDLGSVIPFALPKK